MTTIVAAVRNEPKLMRLIAVDALGAFSDQIAYLAIPAFAILALGLSASQASVLYAVQSLPALLLAESVGRVADRYDRRSLLLAGSVLSAISIVIFYLLYDVPRTWQLGVLGVAAFLYALGGLACSIASSAVIPTILNTIDVAGAISMQSAARSSGRLVGQASAALATQLIGALAALGGSGFLCVLKAMSAISLRAPSPQVSTNAKSESTIGSWRTVWRLPTLRNLTVAMFLLNAGGAVIGGMFFPYAFGPLGLSPLQVGLMLFAGGVSAIAGARFTPVLMKRTSDQTLAATAGIIASGSTWLLALASLGMPLLIVLIYETIFSVAATVFAICYGVIRQRSVPNQLLGRVSGVAFTSNAVAIVGGPLLAATVVDLIGMVSTCMLGSVISASGALCLIRLINPVSESQSTQQVPSPELSRSSTGRAKT